MKKFITILLLFASFTSYSQIKTIKIRGDSNLIKASVYYMLDSAIAAHGGVSVVTASAPLSITSTPTLTPNVVADTTEATSTALVNQRQLVAASNWIRTGSDIYNANSGFVGIGTTTPGYTLDMQKGGGTSTDAAKLNLMGYTGTSSSSGSYLLLGSSNGTTVGSLVPTTANKVLGIIDFNGVNNSNALAFSARIIASQRGDVGGTYVPARLGLYTGGSVSAPAERLSIDTSGNVGIGINAPAKKLVVYSLLSDDGLRIQNSLGTTTTVTTTLSGSTAGTLSGEAYEAKIAGTSTANFLIGTDQANPLKFYTANAVRMTISSTGNVGIGVITPDASAKLDITSTTQGLLLPRMTTAQRNAIGSPAAGLVIYNTTDSTIQYNRISGWSSLGNWIVAAGKTPTINNSITFNGTDGTTMTFPTTTATMARTDASQSFSGTNTFVTTISTTELKTNATAVNSNFLASSSNALPAAISTAAYITGGNNIQFRVGFRGSVSTVATASSDVFAVAIGDNSYTEATSGTSALGGGLYIKTQSFTGGSGATTDFQNLYVGNAPTGGTNNYAINTGLVHEREGHEFAYVAKTGTYTATASDYIINCTANTFTVTLPTAVGIAGRVYIITNPGSGTITIGTTSSQTFTNVTTTPTTLTLLTLGASVQVASDGANWIKLN